MSKRYSELKADNDETLKEIMDKMDKIDEQIYENNCKIYEAIVRSMDDKELGYEFADKEGDECHDFKRLMYHYGRKFVEDYLIDSYCMTQFNWLNK